NSRRPWQTVKAFLDSSVLVAAFYSGHEHHKPSIALLSQQKKATGCTAGHCLAEFYAVATGMPPKLRASPNEALLFLADVRERLAVVALTAEEYFGRLEEAAQSGIIGGACYDALIAACATKSNAQSIYTWNTKHFHRFGQQVSARVREP